MADASIDILIDAGPLIAILNRCDNHHIECSRIIESLNCAFYTTLPVLDRSYVHCARACRLDGSGSLSQSLVLNDITERDQEHRTLVPVYCRNSFQRA